VQTYDFDLKALLLADSLTNIDEEQHRASGKVTPSRIDSLPTVKLGIAEKLPVKSSSDVLGLPRVGQRTSPQINNRINEAVSYRHIKRNFAHSIIQ